MQFTMRKFAPVLAVLTIALAGCQTTPKQAADTGASAPQSEQAQASTVEFFVAQATTAPGLIEVKIPDGSMFVQRQPVLTRADLSEAAALVDRDGNNFVGLRFNEAGARKLNDVSNQNIGNMLALVIDRELVAAPKITEPLNRGVLAFGVPNAESATAIAAKIRGDEGQNAASGSAGSAAPAAAPAPAAP